MSEELKELSMDEQRFLKENVAFETEVDLQKYFNVVVHLLSLKQSLKPINEKLVMQFLVSGVEQISKKPKSAFFNSILISDEIKKFLEFLADINKNYGFPSPLQVQILQGEMLLNQAKLLDPAKNVGDMPQLVESMMEIFTTYDALYGCSSIAILEKHSELRNTKEMPSKDKLEKSTLYLKDNLDSIQACWLEKGEVKNAYVTDKEKYKKLAHLISNKSGIEKVDAKAFDEVTSLCGYTPLYSQNIEERMRFLDSLFLVGISKLSFMQTEKMRPYHTKYTFLEKFLIGMNQFKAGYSFFDLSCIFYNKGCGYELYGFNKYSPFKSEFLLSVLRNYCKAHVPQLIADKNFDQLAILYSNINSASSEPFDNKAMVSDAKREVAEIQKNWFASLDSLQDYIETIRSLEHINDFFLDRDGFKNMEFDLKRFGKLLKTHDDYKRVLEPLLDLLKQSDFALTSMASKFITAQLKLFAKINLDMTLLVVSEIRKANQSSRIMEGKSKVVWDGIMKSLRVEQQIQYPPLLAGLIKLQPDPAEFFTKIEKKLGDIISIASFPESPENDDILDIQYELTEASIGMLSIFYQDLELSKLANDSAEKKFVAGILLTFMALQKPTSEQYALLMDALYNLKKNKQFTENGIDHRFITDLLIIRAQSLSTLEEFKTFAQLLSMLENQYKFPEGSIEHQLMQAVALQILTETDLSLLENSVDAIEESQSVGFEEGQTKILSPLTYSSVNLKDAKEIGDFKPETLFNQLTTFKECAEFIGTFIELKTHIA